jgi:hypothetical protein
MPSYFSHLCSTSPVGEEVDITNGRRKNKKTEDKYIDENRSKTMCKDKD